MKTKINNLKLLTDNKMRWQLVKQNQDLVNQLALAIEALENTKKHLEVIYSQPEFRTLSASYKIVSDALAKIKDGSGAE